MNMSISAIIPAYNEEQCLASTISSLRLIDYISQIVVVDDGSRDRTLEIAQQYADEIIHLPTNIGKGAALKKGCERAAGGIIVFVDSDLQDSAVMVKQLVKPVLAGEADMSIAMFPPAKKKGGFGLVKGLARQGIKRLTGYTALSPLSGQRALTKEGISRITSWDDGFGIEVGMTIDVIRAGLRVVEIPVSFTHRETGRNLAGFMHRGKQFIHVGRTLSRKWYYHS
jgi:glycosyltransferase involved in cell wall biosynthesis